uniref:Uncharacterized protein n=1 Tax=Oryza nivara TaxID=4536 RepID=A0A0E0FYE5_ORYNI
MEPIEEPSGKLFPHFMIPETTAGITSSCIGRESVRVIACLLCDDGVLEKQEILAQSNFNILRSLASGENDDDDEEDATLLSLLHQQLVIRELFLNARGLGHVGICCNLK